jgi:hypothetical protein
VRHVSVVLGFAFSMFEFLMAHVGRYTESAARKRVELLGGRPRPTLFTGQLQSQAIDTTWEDPLVKL